MPEPGRTTVPYWVTTEADARKAVEELAAHKVDIVKIWVDSRDGKYKKLTPEIYAAVIDEAHKRGLRVTAHIFELEDAKGLIRAGIDAFAHGVRDRDIDDELVAMFRQRPNLVLTPNLPDRGVKADLGWLRAGLPADELAKLEAANTDRPEAQAAYGIQARNLAKLNAAGVRITLGTDGNRPWGPHEEMLDMVLAGMTPMQVIVAATRNSAEFLRLADVGTLEAGKSADFIVLDANPLDDITNTRRISAVYPARRPRGPRPAGPLRERISRCPSPTSASQKLSSGSGRPSGNGLRRPGALHRLLGGLRGHPRLLGTPRLNDLGSGRSGGALARRTSSRA